MNSQVSVRTTQWHPTPVFLPGKSHGQRSLVGCSPWGRWGSDTTERLHFHFSLWCIGGGNGNPLQCSCLENPRDGAACWAAVYGVAQSRTRLKLLSSSSTIGINMPDGTRTRHLEASCLLPYPQPTGMKLPSCCNKVPGSLWYFLGGAVVKNLPASAADARDTSSKPGLGRSLGGGIGKQFQYSCLGDPMDGGAWWAAVCGVERVGYGWVHTRTSLWLPVWLGPSHLTSLFFNILICEIMSRFVILIFYQCVDCCARAT